MPVLNVEHIALNVSDSVAIAAWYVEHLGMRIVRKTDAPPHIHFLADAKGRVVIELYSNPVDPIPDYRRCIRCVSISRSRRPIGRRQDRAGRGGATYVEEMSLPDGSRPLTLLHPWGLAIQLCARVTPLLPAS